MATTTRKQATTALRKGIQGGLNSGNTMGAMMGFMGLPWLTKGNDVRGGYGGPPKWVNAEDFANGYGGFGSVGGGGGGPQIEDPPLPPLDPNDPNGDGSGEQYWKFPQYSQTWAFTPPEPTPYPTPQPFDPKKYGNPFAKKF